MAHSAELKLDSKGIKEILKSANMREMVDEAADAIAKNAESTLPTSVTTSVGSYTTDRAAASVQINDVRGMRWQAENGALSKAAKSIGADFKGKA